MRPLEAEGIRPAEPDDLPSIVALAGTALGWRPGDPNEALFRWKHLDNPFGPSGLWVGEEDGQVVAFRALLRWRFEQPEGADALAVRAVDTATHPDHQGRGWFRRLTLHALEQVRAEGTAFVFNTPNDQSRPGYLKMGWQVVGPVPVAVRVRSPLAARRMRGAKVPAGKWSLGTRAGVDAEDVLADSPALDALLASQPVPRGLRTARTAAFLRWRYAEGPTTYRALLRGTGIEDGMALFRLRSRGAAVEATLCDVLVPEGDRRLRRELVTQVRRVARPDYVIRVQRPLLQDGMVRVPRLGPLLTWRALHRETMPPPAAWDLCLGDVELF